MATKIQFRRGLAVEWAVTNPILSEGELGLETDTKLYKIGDGIKAWNSLSYSQLTSTIGMFTMDHQETPTPPALNQMRLYARRLSGRMLPRIMGPSGVDTPLQPSFFQNNIQILSTGAATSLTTIGQTATSLGTISHPAQTEQYGSMANFVSAATVNATAGTSFTGTPAIRGTMNGANGFFVSMRLGFPDTSYDQVGAISGSRIFAGVTNQTMANAVTADNLGGSHHAGFQRVNTDTGRQDVNWQFITKDGAVQNQVDTGMLFMPQKIYDFYLFCIPQGTTIFWRIDNITDGGMIEGAVTANLPGAGVFMRPGFQLLTANAVARNIRMSRVYMESDR